jgi:hypothetical protein
VRFAVAIVIGLVVGGCSAFNELLGGMILIGVIICYALFK